MRARNLALALVVAVAGFAAGSFWQGREAARTAAGPAGSGEREVLFYRHPMDPSITSPTPARDSMGMDYIPVYAGAARASPDDGSGVAVSAAVRQSLGVRTAPVRRVALAGEVRATGVLRWDESRIEHVHTRVEGWVRDLHAHAVGDPVRAGQVLATLDSNVLDAAQREHLVAVSAGDAALAAASRERLRALGMTAAQVAALERSGRSSRAVPVRAPGAGVITALGVRTGMYVTPDTELFALAPLDPLWLDAELLERDAGRVGRGDAARVELAHLPGEVRMARVDYVYPALDPATRAQRVRLVVPNPDAALRAGMWASVRLAPQAAAPVLAVPIEAVIRTGSGARVVVERPDGRFESRPVRLGRGAGALVALREGVAEGERVVTSAQFLLDAEAAAAAALAALDGGARSGPGAAPAPHDAAGHQATDRPAPVAAVVRGLDAANRRITLEHGAIEALGMPAMTMPFDLAPGVDLAGVAAGQRVRARIEPSPRGPVVTAIVPAGAP